MMSDLKQGTLIKTRNFRTVKVGEKIGEGGQGAVYRVLYNGKPKALKWYSGKKLKNPERFYENLENNIKKGAPNGAFLWPEDITEKNSNGAFGYIMNLRPPEFRDFSQFLLAQEHFASVTALVNTALRITAAFRELHNSGYSYQDLNDGNFFINPKTGEVLICDNDNVAEYGKNLGIAGKCRYIAPEIVLGKEVPGINTDKFSLAVVLFLLLFCNHPLEGKKAYPPCMTEALERKIYGEEPVFIFDPKDRSNEALPGINNNALKRWPLFPKYIQDEFIRAFSKEALSDGSCRVIERDWLKAFIRLRGEIYKCPGTDKGGAPCGNVFFADPLGAVKCPQCGREQVFDSYIETPKYKIPLHRRTRLYACHTEGDSDDFETLTGEAVKDEQTGAPLLKNRSKKSWLAITPGGKQVSKGPGKTVALEKGAQIIFGALTARIK
ncbi:MAG: serine/threonine-protein kinase [Spirochaetales bacterium]|jgi:serine/threonine protein kinase|nr:serine/threonine-protein kinase [Spirochaetales bacterium]